MYCLTNICYVCLKKKNNLINSVNSSVSVNEELRRIIGYHTFNQSWLKTKRIILACEECYSLLRKTYQFLKMWHKNSALMQDYIDLLNTTTITRTSTGNEAELRVHVNMKQPDINDVKREVKLEDEQMYTFQWEHYIEETEDTLVDFEDSLVKEIAYKKKKVAESEACPTANYSTEVIEKTNDVFVNVEDSSIKQNKKRIRKEVNDTEEYLMDNNSTESIDNESDSEISVNDNSHVTDTDNVSFGFAGKQMHATNKDDLNTTTKKTYKCSTCNKTFITKTELNKHTRIHTDKKLHECNICNKRFIQKRGLVFHMRVHTGEKPYKCTTCKKCFAQDGNLVRHMRSHTGEKTYECSTCKKCYTQSAHLVRHMRTHTGKKPYECATCKKRFTRNSILVLHMRIHTGDKRYECVTCKKCFMCRWHLMRHMLVHTGEKPYKCTKCSKYFRHKSSIKSHMRNKHPDEESH